MKFLLALLIVTLPGVFAISGLPVSAAPPSSAQVATVSYLAWLPPARQTQAATFENLTYDAQYQVQLPSYPETGCVAAQGKSKASDVASAIAGAFKSLTVTRAADRRIMQYWGPIATPNPGIFTTKDLLHNADGRCGAWQNFMIDVLKAQQISSQAIIILDKQPASVPAGFTFDVADSGLAVYSSLPAQGNPKPPYKFTNHWVLEIPSLFDLAVNVYDPSYGKVYSSGTLASSQQAWEDAAIDYYLYVYVDNNGNYVSDTTPHPDAKGSRETNFFNTSPNS